MTTAAMTRDRSVFGDERSLGDDHVVVGTVDAVHHGLVPQRAFVREDFVVGLPVVVGQHSTLVRLDLPADDVLARDAEHFLPRRVHERHAPVGVADDDGKRQGFEQCAHDAQSVGESPLELLAFGDVGVSAGHACGPAVAVALRDAAVSLEPHPAAVGVTHAMLELQQRHLPADHFGCGDVERGEVFRMDERAQVFHRQDLVVFLEPEESEVGVIEEQVAGVEIPIPQPEIRGFERDLQALIAGCVCCTCIAHVVDERETALAQHLHVDGVARAQARDQRFDLGFRAQTERLRQLLL